jgi:methylmalonyl-CoA mutase
MDQKLFTDFPPVTPEQWDEVIIKDLKGADYDKKLVKKTPEGFGVRPFYSARDIEGLAYLDTAPGVYPFLRGTQTDNRWKLVQTVYPSSEGVVADNAAIRKAYEKGADTVAYRVKDGGISEEDFQKLTADIDLSKVELRFNLCCDDCPSAVVGYILAKAKAENLNPKDIKASVDYDPLRRLTLAGDFGAKGADKAFAVAARLVADTQPAPDFCVINVSPYVFHNAGANIVQELAFGMSMGSEYLSRLSDAGTECDKAAERMRFTFSIGTDYFSEIAKFRAARLLWAEIVGSHCECPPKAGKIKTHAVTSARNQTLYDPYVNLLRGTTEAMSAALAGVDSIEVTPFDSSFAENNEFSSRVARNTQLLLKEESYLDRVTDPAAGSYYIEKLTSIIASEAWKLFLATEEQGGYVEAFGKGFIAEQISDSARKREANVATRRETVLGTNQYPNFNERLDKKTLNSEVFGTLEHCPRCKPAGANAAVSMSRLAKQFEQMRAATDKAEKQPVAFMLTFGNLAMCRARAQFSCNFFACAGFKVMDNNRFATVEDGVDAAVKAGADIVVACSSDDEYTVSVPAINERLGGRAILVVAGEPAGKAELEAKGVTHFISVRSNVLDTLKAYQKELSVN